MTGSARVKGEGHAAPRLSAIPPGNLKNGNSNGAPFHRLYVGNIHFSVTEPDLQQIFEPYGELEQVILQRDEHTLNSCRYTGSGFVQFVDPNNNARNALAEMNGFALAGRQIHVGLGNDKFIGDSDTVMNVIAAEQKLIKNKKSRGIMPAGKPAKKATEDAARAEVAALLGVLPRAAMLFVEASAAARAVARVVATADKSSSRAVVPLTRHQD